MGLTRVLVIEDETSAREALHSLLSEEGFIVRSAPSGLAGMDSFRDFQPDIVLCDYYLPDLDGLQVLRRIRDSGDHDVRFIVLTAGLSGDENEKALRAEADAFLGKPIDLAQLQSALRPGNSLPDAGWMLNATS